MADKGRWFNRLIGLAVSGAALAGIVSITGAFVAVLSDEWAAAGACLIAAALSFGLLARALLED